MSLAELSSRCSSAPEPDSLRVAAANIAAFSLPQEALSFQPGNDIVFSKLANGEEERKIHCNTELRKAEQEQLLELWKEADRKEDNFPPSVAITATRYLSFTRGDHLSALEHMRQTHAWRCSYFKDGPLTDSAMEEDLRHGAVYFAGRDRALRPLLVIRPARAPANWIKERRSDKLLTLLVFCMEYFVRYMVLPGRVENLSVILDLQGVGVSQLPLGALTDIYKVMSHHYIIRVFRFYVCNMPTLLSTVAGQFKRRIMTDRQRQKLFFVNDFKLLAHEFAAHQLERDFGGGRPIIKEFWPFPLQPGPFRVDCRHPRSDAVPKVHEAISAAGMRGKLWDPAASHFDNTQLDYTDVAEAILRRCGLPIPQHLPEQRQATVLWLKATGEGTSPKHRVSIGHRNGSVDNTCQEATMDSFSRSVTAAEVLPSDGCFDIPLNEDLDDEEERFWSPKSSLSSEDAAPDCTMLHPREDSAERETEMGSSNDDCDGDTESPRDDEYDLPVLELMPDIEEGELGQDGAMSETASALGDSYNLLHESDAEALEGRRLCGPRFCCQMFSAAFRRRAHRRRCSSSHSDSTSREVALDMLEAPPEQLRMTLLEAP